MVGIVRRLAAEYFERDVLDGLLPPAGKRLEFADGIKESAGMNAILGFLYRLGHEAGSSGGTS